MPGRLKKDYLINTIYILFTGLQYAYLNNDSKSKGDDISSQEPSLQTSPQENGAPALSSKSARSEITLDELSDLYRNEEEEQLRAERRKSLAPNSILSTSNFSSNSTQQISSSHAVQLRVSSASRDDLSCKNNNNNNNRPTKKINRLSRKYNVLFCKIVSTFIGL